MVLYDISPIVDGHSLIVPKRHVERVSNLRDGELIDLVRTARHVSDRFIAALGSTGVDWALQDGYDAGQTVPHVHLHVIPRSAGDLGREPGNWYHRLPGGRPLGRAIENGSRRPLGPEALTRRVTKFARIMGVPETSADPDLDALPIARNGPSE
jgi:bis(5'-adenosyl)-triphosphatase